MKQEDIDKYINHRGLHCPYCNSPEIEGNYVNVDAGFAWQKIKCLNCDKSWINIYKLVNIEEEF